MGQSDNHQIKTRTLKFVKITHEGQLKDYTTVG